MGYGVINTTRVQMTYAAEAGSANNETTYINNSSARIVFDITYTYKITAADFNSVGRAFESC